jgi:hypothetical protein
MAHIGAMFVLLVVVDTVQQISFKIVAEHALPIEATPAFILRLLSQPSSLVIIATAIAWLLIYTYLLRVAPWDLYLLQLTATSSPLLRLRLSFSVSRSRAKKLSVAS